MTTRDAAGRPASVFPPPASEHSWVAAESAAVERYHEVLTRYVDRGGEDHLALLDRLVARGAVFGGRPICPFLRPQLVLRGQHDLMVKAVRRFRSAVVKLRDRIVADPELLDQLALSDGERRLFSYNPEFKSFGVMTRLDGILTGDDFQMVELNAEGAFGVCWADRLTELFEGFQPMREFSRSRRVTPVYQGNALMSALLDTWHDFGGKRVPRVAVVDWKEVETRAELDMVCETLARHGIPARFVDPRELTLRDGALEAGGEGIDVVYRRVLTSDILAREDEVRPLVEAYRTGAVCVVNSFRAKLLDKKVLFAMLHDPELQTHLLPEEIEAIRRHVPWTRRVAESRTTGPDGDPIDLLPWASENRAALVIKPNDEVLGRGVTIGANVDQVAWDRALSAAVHEPSIVQRRVPLPSAMFPEIGAAGELFYARRYIEIDPYLFRGESRGLSGRLSALSLQHVYAGAGTVPVFILEDEGLS